MACGLETIHLLASRQIGWEKLHPLNSCFSNWMNKIPHCHTSPIRNERWPGDPDRFYALGQGPKKVPRAGSWTSLELRGFQIRNGGTPNHPSQFSFETHGDLGTPHSMKPYETHILGGNNTHTCIHR
jgi:hypothetical protein